MADYAKHFKDLKLWKELGKSAGRDDLDAEDIKALEGLVVDVAEHVGPVLARISSTFHQYTAHDILHSRNVADRMGKLIPKKTLSQLNGLELSLLMLSAMLHDVGMAVSDDEKAKTVTSESFQRFRQEGHADRVKAAEEARGRGKDWRARLIEDAMLADYYRRLHAGRVHDFLRRELADRVSKVAALSHPTAIVELGNLCESHSWGVDESHDAAAPKKAVKELDTESLFNGTAVNLQYLACLLRLADILDFDRSRTPLSVFQHLTFTEPMSWQEWNKHIEVQGWRVEPDRIRFNIPCSHPAFYVAVQEFLGWIDQELTSCRQLIERQPARLEERYRLDVPHIVDRSKVRMADSSYVAGAFRFQLEYEEILRLLMDKSLYPDPSLFLRELLQNSLDACRRKEAEYKLKGLPYEGRITVRDFSTDPDHPRIEFEDNGIGMSLRIVEQYFLRVGKSYYLSPEFDAERARYAEKGIELDVCSQFGIGILSCFMVCDRFEVWTRVEGGELLHLEVEGPGKYFALRRLEGVAASRSGRLASALGLMRSGAPSGSTVVVHLSTRETVDCLKTLQEFSANVDYPVAVHTPQSMHTALISARKWEQSLEAATVLSSAVQRPFNNAYDASCLTDVVVAERVPLEAWSFSRHLRGSLWFWLLRDPDGYGCPERGYLRLNRGVEIFGLPCFLSKLERFLCCCDQNEGLEEMVANQLRAAYSSGRPEGQKPFSRLLTGGNPTAAQWERVAGLLYQLREPGAGGAEPADTLLALDREWAGLGMPEQLAAVDFCQRFSRDGRRAWPGVPGLAQALLEGSLDWTGKRVSFGRMDWFHWQNFEVRFKEESSESIAVGSILIPGGFASWRPGATSAQRVRFLEVPGGLRLDIRGADAPRPVSSRLYISASEAARTQSAISRACLLHATKIAQKSPQNGAFRSWLAMVASDAYEWKADGELVRPEIGYVEERMGFLARREGTETILHRGDLEKMFGRRVPLVSSDGDGVLAEDPLNKYFLAGLDQANKGFISVKDLCW